MPDERSLPRPKSPAAPSVAQPRLNLPAAAGVLVAVGGSNDTAPAYVRDRAQGPPRQPRVLQELLLFHPVARTMPKSSDPPDAERLAGAPDALRFAGASDHQAELQRPGIYHQPAVSPWTDLSNDTPKQASARCDLPGSSKRSSSHLGIGGQQLNSDEPLASMGSSGPSWHYPFPPLGAPLRRYNLPGPTAELLSLPDPSTTAASFACSEPVVGHLGSMVISQLAAGEAVPCNPALAGQRSKVGSLLDGRGAPPKSPFDGRSSPEPLGLLEPLPESSPAPPLSGDGIRPTGLLEALTRVPSKGASRGLAPLGKVQASYAFHPAGRPSDASGGRQYDVSEGDVGGVRRGAERLVGSWSAEGSAPAQPRSTSRGGDGAEFDLRPPTLPEPEAAGDDVPPTLQLFSLAARITTGDGLGRRGAASLSKGDHLGVAGQPESRELARSPRLPEGRGAATSGGPSAFENDELCLKEVAALDGFPSSHHFGNLHALASLAELQGVAGQRGGQDPRGWDIVANKLLGGMASGKPAVASSANHSAAASARDVANSFNDGPLAITSSDKALAAAPSERPFASDKHFATASLGKCLGAGFPDKSQSWTRRSSDRDVAAGQKRSESQRDDSERGSSPRESAKELHCSGRVACGGMEDAHGRVKEAHGGSANHCIAVRDSSTNHSAVKEQQSLMPPSGLPSLKGVSEFGEEVVPRWLQSACDRLRQQSDHAGAAAYENLKLRLSRGAVPAPLPSPPGAASAGTATTGSGGGSVWPPSGGAAKPMRRSFKRKRTHAEKASSASSLASAQRLEDEIEKWKARMREMDARVRAGAQVVHPGSATVLSKDTTKIQHNSCGDPLLPLPQPTADETANRLLMQPPVDTPPTQRVAPPTDPSPAITGLAPVLADICNGPHLALANVGKGPGLAVSTVSKGPSLGLAGVSRGPSLDLADVGKEPALGLAEVGNGPTLGLTGVSPSSKSLNTLCPVGSGEGRVRSGEGRGGSGEGRGGSGEGRGGSGEGRGGSADSAVCQDNFSGDDGGTRRGGRTRPSHSSSSTEVEGLQPYNPRGRGRGRGRHLGRGRGRRGRPPGSRGIQARLAMEDALRQRMEDVGLDVRDGVRVRGCRAAARGRGAGFSHAASSAKGVSGTSEFSSRPGGIRGNDMGSLLQLGQGGVGSERGADAVVTFGVASGVVFGRLGSSEVACGTQGMEQGDGIGGSDGVQDRDATGAAVKGRAEGLMVQERVEEGKRWEGQQGAEEGKRWEGQQRIAEEKRWEGQQRAEEGTRGDGQEKAEEGKRGDGRQRMEEVKREDGWLRVEEGKRGDGRPSRVLGDARFVLFGSVVEVPRGVIEERQMGDGTAAREDQGHGRRGRSAGPSEGGGRGWTMETAVRRTVRFGGHGGNSSRGEGDDVPFGHARALDTGDDGTAKRRRRENRAAAEGAWGNDNAQGGGWEPTGDASVFCSLSSLLEEAARLIGSTSGDLAKMKGAKAIELSEVRGSRVAAVGMVKKERDAGPVNTRHEAQIRAMGLKGGGASGIVLQKRGESCNGVEVGPAVGGQVRPLLVRELVRKGPSGGKGVELREAGVREQAGQNDRRDDTGRGALVEGFGDAVKGAVEGGRSPKRLRRADKVIRLLEREGLAEYRQVLEGGGGTTLEDDLQTTYSQLAQLPLPGHVPDQLRRLLTKPPPQAAEAEDSKFPVLTVGDGHPMAKRIQTLQLFKG